MNKKHLIGIIVLGVCATIVIQWNLTDALLFHDYWKKPGIVYENNDETYYLAFMKESSEGNWSLGNPFLKEWSSQPYLYIPLNVYMAGMAQKLWGLDIKTTSIIFDYGTVFIVAGLTLTLFLLLFRFHWFGYFVGIAYLFLPRTIHLWKRPISPQINFIPLLLFFIFYFSRARFWVRELGMAVSAGALFYTYPYHWTFVLIFLILSDLVVFVERKKVISAYLWKYLIIVALSVGYLVNLWNIYRVPYYQETMGRIGAISSRLPAGYYTQALIVAFLIISYTFRKKLFNQEDNLKGIVLGLVASLVVLNQQLVTGMQLEFNTHYLPVILLFMVAFFASVDLALCSYKRFLQLLSVLFVLGLVCTSAVQEITHSPFREEKSFMTSYAYEVYQWFNDQNIHNAVVYAPRELTEGIPIYTNNYVSFSELARLQLMPTQELIDRFRYYDIDNIEITKNPFAFQRDIFGVYYIAQMQKDLVWRRIQSFFGADVSGERKLGDYIPFDFEALKKQRENVKRETLENYFDTFHVEYLVYQTSPIKNLFSQVPGDIVFENIEYVIKRRP